MRSLQVLLNERPVGTLTEGNDLWAFDCDPAWAAAPDGFDLSPTLTRSVPRHEDGGSNRPVQWYFDNLLPEEGLREAIGREADIQGDDAFALLEHLGAESAGSLVLSPPGRGPASARGLQALTDEALFARILRLPRTTLQQGAPKRMSLAGAQHKLLVVLRDGALFEPVGAEPSTHILKPDHPDSDCPASVINEFAAMRLAAALKLTVPPVQRRYTPEPVYIVERFDRFADTSGHTQRRHIIDACQLLNKPRGFKYRAASLASLQDVILACRNRVGTRLRLYQWLVFNVLVGNHDNHLKNLSFVVSAEGISLAPFYDLLSTAAYSTRAFADERANWPDVRMAVALPGAETFAQVTRRSLLDAAQALGLSKAIGERELSRLTGAMPGALATVIASIDTENVAWRPAARRFMAGEKRLLNTLQRLVMPEMIRRSGL